MSALGGAVQVGANLAKGSSNVAAQVASENPNAVHNPTAMKNAMAYGTDLLFDNVQNLSHFRD